MIVIPQRERRAPVRRSPAQVVEEDAYCHGETYDSYLALEPDRRFYVSPNGLGSLAYVPVGQFLQVGGGLLAAPEDKPGLLSEFISYARERRLFVTFYNLPEQELPLFREHGFQITKWGEEALVDLETSAWQGKQFEWVRRQSNYCLRKGLQVSEFTPRGMGRLGDARLTLELARVASEALEARPQRTDVRFMEGSFDLERLGRKRVFLARADEGRGRVEGLLVCNPGAAGAMWSFELYRHRRDCVRGTMAFLMHQVMQQLKREGVERVSLCLIPGQNCAQPLPGDSRLTRWSLVIGSRYFSFIFDTAGTAYFKSRFRPRYESRYIAAWPRQTVTSAWAFVRALGVLELDYKKTLRLAAGECVRAGRKLLRLSAEVRET